MNALKRFTFSNPGEVGFPHNARNRDHCSLFSIADTTCNGGIAESKLIRKNDLPFITLEIKNVQFSALLGEVFISIYQSIACMYLATTRCARQKGQGLLQNM